MPAQLDNSPNGAKAAMADRRRCLAALLVAVRNARVGIHEDWLIARSSEENRATSPAIGTPSL
jgi:hypothetical protein